MLNNKEFDSVYNLELLKRISNRDVPAMSEFYDIHSKYLYTMICYMIPEEEESTVLLEEVFLEIWNNVISFDETVGNPIAWITRITRNKTNSRIKNTN